MSGRCQACNDILSEREMKIRDETGHYTNMCDKCKRITFLAENDYYESLNDVSDILFGYAKQESYRE